MGDPLHRWFEEMKFTLDELKNVRDDVRLAIERADGDAIARFGELERTLDDQQHEMRRNLFELIARFHTLKHQLAVPDQPAKQD